MLNMSARRDNRSGKGHWFYRKMVRLPDGRRVRIFGVPTTVGLPDSKEGAEQAERDHLTRVLKTGEVTQTPPPPMEVPTFREFVPILMASSAVSNKESWQRSKEIMLRLHLVPYLGDKRLNEIGFAVIEDLKITLANKNCGNQTMRKLSKKTINNCLAVLHRALSLARMRGLIAGVPHFEWFKAPPAEFDFLTFEESARLLAAVEGEFHTMLLVALRTGLRFGELIALRWEDVDLVAGKVIVRRRLYRGKFDTPKSGKPREVPLSDEARAALKRHRHLRGELVFCHLDGRPLNHRASTRKLWRACKRARLRALGWHTMRHTFASQLAMEGARLGAIQDMLGHANIQMTMRYAHLSPEVAHDSVQLLDRRGTPEKRGSVVAATA
jgi:integrase